MEWQMTGIRVETAVFVIACRKSVQWISGKSSDSLLLCEDQNETTINLFNGAISDLPT
jgi:hypothetical protein